MRATSSPDSTMVKTSVEVTEPVKFSVPTAVMVYEVESIATVGVPLSAPPVSLSVRPEGRVGETEYVAVAPEGVSVGSSGEVRGSPRDRVNVEVG